MGADEPRARARSGLRIKTHLLRYFIDENVYEAFRVFGPFRWWFFGMAVDNRRGGFSER